MGNYNFTPKHQFQKNQKVDIKGFGFTEEHVPKEIMRLGKTGMVLHTMKLHQSRKNAPTLYATRIYFPQHKYYETFLTNDLVPLR